MRKKITRYAIICGVIIFLFLIFSKFQLRQVIIIAEDFNIKGLSILNGLNLLFLDDQKIISRLVKSNPLIKKLTLEKEYPETIVILVEPRKPVSWLMIGNFKKVIDREGVVISDSSDLNLPSIEVSSLLITSWEKPDWRISKALDIITSFKNYEIEVKRVQIEEDLGMFVVETTSGSQIFIPYSLEIPKVAASLQTITFRFRIEGKFLKIIDFRFDKPVVTLENGEKISSF